MASLGAAAAPLALSPAEQAWAAGHPVVRVGLTGDFAPFYVFEDSAATVPHGFVSELLALWSERTGLRFEYRRHGSLDEVLAALRAGEIDMTPFTTPLGERESYAAFTRPALTTNLVLAARRDVPDVSSTADFGGRTVAVEAGSSIEALVRERHPGTRLLREATAERALRAVADGQADLFIGYQHVVVYLVEKGLLANLELRTSLGPSATPLGPAVRRDLPLLRSILDKAIASVSVADQSRLASRWLPPGSTTVRLPPERPVLSAAARDWLARHPRIRVGYDAMFSPITLRGPLGEFQGLGADLLRLVAGKVGLEIEQEVGASFAEVYAQGVDGRLDVIVGMARTARRRAEYDFVGPFLSVPTAIVMPVDEGPLITETQDIGHHKLALLRGHFLIPELRSRHPGITIVELDRQDQVLAAVAEGAADVAMGNVQVVNELIQRRFAGRLRVTGTVRDGDSELFLAVPRRSPELTHVLSQGLAAVNDSEAAALRARWLLVEVNDGVPSRRILLVGGPVLLVLLGYGALLWRGNRRLRAARQREREARLLAEESTAARGRFLAYLSHELRGNLGAVVSGAQMLLDRDDPALRRRLLTAIADSARVLRSVLDKTIAYEQSIHSPIALEPRSVDLQAWLTQTLAPGRLEAERKGLEFHTQWTGDSPTVAFDDVRLQQVLINLVGNAVKFTRAGRVAVSGCLDERPQADALRRDAESPTCYLRLEVQDSGPGLSPADHAQLFEPYAQGVQGRAISLGAGLGLAISRQIVDAMQGRIEVDSRPGEGARFIVTVPVQRCPAPLRLEPGLPAA